MAQFLRPWTARDDETAAAAATAATAASGERKGKERRRRGTREGKRKEEEMGRVAAVGRVRGAGLPPCAQCPILLGWPSFATTRALLH
jgi:hypothetical protein